MLWVTWFNHIMARHGHPYMKHKVPLIKRAVGQIQHKSSFLRYSGDPKNCWFYDYECIDFSPMHKCLRIAFKEDMVNDTNMVIMTSTFKVERGVIAYESK